MRNGTAPLSVSLDELVEAARAAFGGDLHSIVLYGSAAENRLRATSDVNVLFVLHRFDKERADAFRESFRVAQAALNVTAMFILHEELPAAAHEFAQKFADIGRRHVVLYGDDPVASLTVTREALANRVRQVLLNLSIRLRELYIERSLREEQCAISVAESAGPLRTSAAAILELEGGGVLAPKDALERIVSELGRNDFTDLLREISSAREQRSLTPGRAALQLFATAQLAHALYERARSL